MAIASSDFISSFGTLVRDPKHKIWDEAEVISLGNMAQRKLQSDGQFKWPENASASSSLVFTGAREYALASNFAQFELLQLNNEILNVKDEISYEEALQINPSNNTTNNLPSRFYLRGGNIGFDYLPSSGTATLSYRKKVAVITDGSTLDFNDNKLEALTHLAAYYGFKRLGGAGAVDKGNSYMEIYKLDLLPELMRSDIARNPSGLSLHSYRKRNNLFRPLAMNRYNG